jgi:hypothetical protein
MAVTADKYRTVTYLDVRIKSLAEKLGKKQRRSLSNLIEVAVDDYIKRAIADGEISENDD